VEQSERNNMKRNKLIKHMASVGMFLAALMCLTAGVYANGTASKRSQAKFEVRFMTDMIDHHAMAVAMAMVCTNEAVHPELRQHCQHIIISQSTEIDQMQAWLQQWYGVTHEPEMKPADEKMMQRLAAMSGEEFEVMFLEMMTRHHRTAVRRAESCQQRAYHPELIALCHNIQQTQSEEIKMMESWLCQWYEICRP
jgi:uncharacterized protein (DUF305 family)